MFIIKGCCHRDVKPANIMVRFTNNEAVLIDFGIAREFTTDLTQTHTIYRTECYAPIEQYNPRGKRGAYMDVYALAATLYFLLTAELPTPAPNRMAGETLIPPKQHNNGISEKVNRGILKGMELRRERRPQSVQAWLRLLGLESSDREEGGNLRLPKYITSWAVGLTATIILGLVLDHVIAPFLIDVPVVGAVVSILCEAVDASCGNVDSSPTSSPTKPSTIPTSEPKSSPSIATAPLKPQVRPQAQATIPERFVLDKTLTGHSNSVLSVAISPDGKTLASGSNDNTIKLWNLETGQLQRTLADRTGDANSVAISPDGKILATGSWDDTIKLWNLETGQLQRTLTGHSDVISVAISPDGKILATGSWDDTIKLWNLETGQLQRTLTGHSDVISVAISPDGKTLATGSNDNTIKLWNLETGQLQRTLTGHSNEVYSVAISPDGKALASGSNDNTIKLWNLETGQLQQTLAGHSGSVWSVSFSLDGQTLVSGSEGGTIKIWQQQ